jgi:hypothetical protein
MHRKANQRIVTFFQPRSGLYKCPLELLWVWPVSYRTPARNTQQVGDSNATVPLVFCAAKPFDRVCVRTCYLRFIP